MMDDFLRSEARDRRIRQIIQNHQNLACESCARAIQQWLRANGEDSQLLRIRTAMGEDFILSQRRCAMGDDESITENGMHYGIQVGDVVFDNPAAEGLPIDQWLADFECQSGDFLLEPID
jgi:Papain fold toxin 2